MSVYGTELAQPELRSKGSDYQKKQTLAISPRSLAGLVNGAA
jgi:hypothetical protein